MTEYSGKERRRFFRLRYPSTARPYFKMLGLQYTVSEISEGGMKILHAWKDDVAHSQQVVGMITFHNGENVPVSGRILRTEKEEVVVVLTKGVPSRTIMDEQRYVISTFPAYKAS